jgi:hypothetical protein
MLVLPIPQSNVSNEKKLILAIILSLSVVGAHLSK